MSIWNITAMNGYIPKTTFWNDFEVADLFGPFAVQETYNTAMREWASDYEFLTELVLVLNHRLWLHYGAKNEKLAKLYDGLWREASDYALKHLKDDELRYYLEVTD